MNDDEFIPPLGAIGAVVVFEEEFIPPQSAIIVAVRRMWSGALFTETAIYYAVRDLFRDGGDDTVIDFVTRIIERHHKWGSIRRVPGTRVWEMAP